MKTSRYQEYLYDFGLAANTIEDDGTYIAYGMVDQVTGEIVLPMDLDTEQSIFAGNEGEDGSYLLYDYYGIFVKAEAGVFACCMPDSGLENITDPGEQLLYPADRQQTTDKQSLKGGQQSVTVEQPTGYASDEVQESYVFVNGSLYSFWAGRQYTMAEEEITVRYEGYSFFGFIREQNDKEKPTQELNAAHVPKDSGVYCNPQEPDSVIVYYGGKAYFFTRVK